MGIFKGEETYQYTTQVGGNVSLDAAIQVLHDHDFVLRLDPHLVSYEEKGAAKDGEVCLTEEVAGRKCGETRFYEVKDSVPERYAKLLPGTPVSVAYHQVTNIKDGVFIYTQAALGIALSREFVVRQGPSGTEIVQKCTAAGAKMLLGTVREQGNETWKGMHSSMVQKMGGTVASQA